MKKNAKLVLLGFYFGVFLIVILFSTVTKALSFYSIGIKLFSTGMAIAVIAFLSMNEYGNRGGTSYVRVLRTDKEFRSWRNSSKPFRDIVMAVVYSSLLIAATGMVFLFL